jgi:hypothetical protein
MQLGKILVVTYDPHAIGKISVATHMQLGNSQLRPTLGISRSWLATTVENFATCNPDATGMYLHCEHMELAKISITISMVRKSQLRPTYNWKNLSCDPDVIQKISITTNV